MTDDTSVPLVQRRPGGRWCGCREHLPVRQPGQGRRRAGRWWSPRTTAAWSGC